MDITVVSAATEAEFIHVFRSATGADSHIWYGGSPDPAIPSTNLMRMPRETLAIRAAEYNLAVDDPRVLDMVMLEHLIPPQAIGPVHPLFAADTIREAGAAMDTLLDKVRSKHGHPADSKFLRGAKKNRSKGLVDSIDILDRHADLSISDMIKEYRDRERSRMRSLL